MAVFFYSKNTIQEGFTLFVTRIRLKFSLLQNSPYLNTLKRPSLIVKSEDFDGFEREVFIKTFLIKKEGILHFVSISKDEDGYLQMVSAHEKRKLKILDIVKRGSVTYQNDNLLSLNILQDFYNQGTSSLQFVGCIFGCKKQ